MIWDTKGSARRRIRTDRLSWPVAFFRSIDLKSKITSVIVMLGMLCVSGKFGVGDLEVGAGVEAGLEFCELAMLTKC